MCEIALINPETVDPAAFHQLSATVYEEQGDGLGILAIKTDGDTFEYDTYRKAEPDWFQVHKFYERTKDDTWRYVIHGRAKTAGKVCNANTHPLPVDCPSCDAEYVIHNGSVRNHQQNRASLISHGHEFLSSVDSEVIAHKVSELPETIENHSYNTYSMTGNLNYFVFFEDGILAKLTQKYYVNEDDFTVACRTRYSKEPINGSIRDTEWANNARWLLITPDGEVERKNSTASTAGGRTSPSGTTSGSPYNSSGKNDSASSGSSVANRSADDENIVVETYEDLVPRLEHVVAIKVAPGVVRVIDEEAGDEEFIHRRDDPAMYYYYAGQKEHVDDEMLQLHKLFDEDGKLRPADDVFHDGDITPQQVLSLLNSDPADVATTVEAEQATLDALDDVGVAVKADAGGGAEEDFR